MRIRRRDVLAGAAAIAACGGEDVRLISPTGRLVPSSAAPRPVPPYAKNPVYHQQPIAPIHLSAAVQLQTGTSGGVPAQALQNPMGQDMEILEVKFEVSGLLGEADSNGTVMGGSIGCEMDLGDYKITNNSVPLWCFGRAENLPAEVKFDTSFGPLSYSAFSWRLPRPLFVPAGAVLLPKFNHFGYLAETLTVRVGYSARSVFKSPRSVCLPWVAAYKSKVFNPISSADKDQSQEQDLVNKTNRPLHLQRFTGRLQFTGPGAGLTSELQPASFGAKYLTMRMMDSYGRPIVRTYTPFRSVFGALTRSWELEGLGAQLDPGGFYRVFLKKAAMTMVAGGTDYNAGYAQAFVSMVGWREEKTS